MRKVIIAQRARDEPISIAGDDRRYHTYILGKTGMGKSTLLLNMIAQDIEGGQGVAVIDPHGDLAERVLSFVPKRRVQEAVYFNPQDVDFPFGLNPFSGSAKRKDLLCSGLVSIFYKLWKESWGPRLEHILRHAILSLLELPSPTLLSIPRLLQDEGWRERMLLRIRDPEVRNFWENEYARYGERFREEAISPILNKVGAFITSPLMRNILCQKGKGLDFSKLLNEGQILIANLPKGALGEDNQRLLGSLLLTKIQLAAMERAKTPEGRRRDFYLYCDEFYNFSTDSFISMLSEARKYHLNLILAHQYLDQLEPDVRHALFGNVGTIIAFRLGGKDAKILEDELSEANVRAENLVNLSKFKVYIRLTKDGIPMTEPFSAETLPPKDPPFPSSRERIIELTRRRFCRRRKEVEDEVEGFFKGGMSGKISVELERKRGGGR